MPPKRRHARKGEEPTKYGGDAKDEDVEVELEEEKREGRQKKDDEEEEEAEEEEEVPLGELSNAELRTRKDDAAKEELAKRQSQKTERRPCHLFTYRSSCLKQRGKKRRKDDDDDDEDEAEEHRHVPKMAALQSAYPDLVAQLKRGDLLEDTDADGYRSSGACAFDGRQCIPLDYDVDEYGGPPLEFEMITDFPPGFFEVKNMVIVPDGGGFSSFYWHSDEPALNLGSEIVEAARAAKVHKLDPEEEYGVVVEWEKEWYLIVLDGGRNQRVPSVVFPGPHRAHAFAKEHGILHENIFGTEL